MPVRHVLLDAATARTRDQLRRIISDAAAARRAAGLPLWRVADAMGCSRQTLARFERGEVDGLGAVALARWCAAVGLDLSMRSFPGGSPLCDAGQLRLLARFREALGDAPWAWATEVAVVREDPRDRRAFDGLLSRAGTRVGVEAITTLIDGQEQTRRCLLKQSASGVDCLLLVLSDTRRNRAAVRDAAPTLDPAFPLRGRALLADLVAGRTPEANGLVLL